MLKHASKKKIWRLSYTPADNNSAKDIAQSLSLSHAMSKLLVSRGHADPVSVRRFIGKETEFLHDPYLLRDMDKAVSRVLRAVAEKERILVYGDYDVDGVTSVTVVYTYLKDLGADVSYYIPNRIGEGYGINLDALRSFKERGITLMITVDTGITAIDEIAKAKAFGLDTVVTDHHECRPELPEAEAVVNPRRPDCPYPFKELAGVGVAFKLLCALEMKKNSADFTEALRYVGRKFAEPVAIGTIADVMPLVDENRIIVSYGLKLLENTSNIGLRALMYASGLISTDAGGNVVKKRITSSAVGYTLAPRINAAGRISSAEVAVELFLTDNAVRADEIAAELCEINRKRQAEENSIIEAAEAKIAEQCGEDDYVIILDDDHWHHGVIGIVCSRLTDKYNLPSILISFEHNMGEEAADIDIGKGSGRSIQGLNLFEALDFCAELLSKYGGHELAAGLSIERGKLPEFRRAINEYAKKQLEGGELSRTVDIDMRLTAEEIGLRLAEELYLLEPFGSANSQPIFETDRLIISEITTLAAGKHTKLTLRAPGSGVAFTALCFGIPTAQLEFSVGDAVDVAYNLDVNEFRGRKSVQLMVRDIRRTKAEKKPCRDDFAKLYMGLRSMSETSYVRISAGELAKKLDFSEEMTEVMLDVFSELSIIDLVHAEDIMKITILPVRGKIPLESSHILAAL